MCLEFKSPSFSSVAELSKGCSLVSSTHEENNRRVQEYGSKGSDYPFLEFRVVNDVSSNSIHIILFVKMIYFQHKP